MRSFFPKRWIHDGKIASNKCLVAAFLPPLIVSIRAYLRHAIVWFVSLSGRAFAQFLDAREDEGNAISNRPS